jgi:hypothetical protein
MGVIDVRIEGQYEFKKEYCECVLMTVKFSIDDNFYDFNKAKRGSTGEFFTFVGRNSAVNGKDYWIKVHGSRIQLIMDVVKCK